MGLLRLRGSSRQAGSDRPDRFVSDNQSAVEIGRGPFAGAGSEDRAQLTVQDFLGLAGFALGSGLADAGDYGESLLQQRLGPLAYGFVGLAEKLPALGMASQYPVNAGFLQQRARKLAGEGAAL